MTITSILDTARNDVLIENTGQAVLKHLRAPSGGRSLVMPAWIAEPSDRISVSDRLREALRVRIAVEFGLSQGRLAGPFEAGGSEQIPRGLSFYLGLAKTVMWR